MSFWDDLGKAITDPFEATWDFMTDPVGTTGDVVGELTGANAAAEATKSAAAASLQATRDTLAQQERLGREGVGRIDQGYGDARKAYLEGQRGALDTLRGQQRIGNTALQRYADAILGGQGLEDMLANDPTLALQQKAGERALARSAAARGALGGGANISDFLQFNQDLTAQSLSNSLSRLGSLADIGLQANANIANIHNQGGSNLASLYAGQGTGAANALSNLQATMAPLQQQQIQAQSTLAAAPYLAEANRMGSLFNLLGTGVGFALGGPAGAYFGNQMTQPQRNPYGGF